MKNDETDDSHGRATNNLRSNDQKKKPLGARGIPCALHSRALLLGLSDTELDSLGTLQPRVRFRSHPTSQILF